MKKCISNMVVVLFFVFLSLISLNGWYLFMAVSAN